MPPFTPSKFRDTTTPKGPLGLKAPTGSTGAPGRDTLTVKKGLRRLGRLQPPVFPDGIRRLNEHPDRETVAGIRSFQQTHGLKPDGTLNPGGPTERTLAAALGKGPKAAAAKARRALPKGPVGTGIKAAQPDVDALTEALAVTGNTLPEDTQTPADRAANLRYAIQDFQRDFPGQLARDGIALPGGPTVTKLDQQLAMMETGDREAQADGILLAAETGPFKETVQTGDDSFAERDNPGTVDGVDGGDGDDTLNGGSGDDTGEATGGDQPNAVTDGNEEDGFLPSPQEAADAVNSVLDSAEDKLSHLDPELAQEARDVMEKAAGGAYGIATSFVGSVEDTADLASDIYNAGMYWATGDEEHRQGAENLQSIKDGLATLIDNPEAIPEAIREDIEQRKDAADTLSEDGKHFEAAAAYTELGTDYLSAAIPVGGAILKSGSAVKGAAKIGKAIADKAEDHLKLELSSGNAKPGQGIGGNRTKRARVEEHQIRLDQHVDEEIAKRFPPDTPPEELERAKRLAHDPAQGRPNVVEMTQALDYEKVLGTKLERAPQRYDPGGNPLPSADFVDPKTGILYDVKLEPQMPDSKRISKVAILSAQEQLRKDPSVVSILDLRSFRSSTIDEIRSFVSALPEAQKSKVLLWTD